MAALASAWLRHFRLHLEIAERNSTKLDRNRGLDVLYQVYVFQADRKNKMTALVSDWLRRFQLLWTEFNETWQEARSQRPLPSVCFSGRSEKYNDRPALWLAETFSTSSLKPLNGIQLNLTRSKISTSSTKFVFFQANRENKMASLASDWLRHSRLLHWNLTGSKISTSSTTLVFIWANWKNKMADPVSDWLRYFRLVLWNR